MQAMQIATPYVAAFHGVTALLLKPSAACGVFGNWSKHVVWFRLPDHAADTGLAVPAAGDA